MNNNFKDCNIPEAEFIPKKGRRRIKHKKLKMLGMISGIALSLLMGGVAFATFLGHWEYKIVANQPVVMTHSAVYRITPGYKKFIKASYYETIEPATQFETLDKPITKTHTEYYPVAAIIDSLSPNEKKSVTGKYQYELSCNTWKFLGWVDDLSGSMVSKDENYYKVFNISPEDTVNVNCYNVPDKTEHIVKGYYYEDDKDVSVTDSISSTKVPEFTYTKKRLNGKYKFHRAEYQWIPEVRTKIVDSKSEVVRKNVYKWIWVWNY